MGKENSRENSTDTSMESVCHDQSHHIIIDRRSGTEINNRRTSLEQGEPDSLSVIINGIFVHSPGSIIIKYLIIRRDRDFFRAGFAPDIYIVPD